MSAFRVKKPISEGERIAAAIAPVAGQLPRATDAEQGATPRQVRQINFKVTREFAKVIRSACRERKQSKRQFFAEMMRAQGYDVPLVDLEAWGPEVEDD